MGVIDMGKLNRKQLERLLERALIPVEPNPEFIKRLRARLITVRGTPGLSGWKIFVLVATSFLILATWLGLLLRVFLGVFSLVGIIARKGRNDNKLKIPI